MRPSRVRSRSCAASVGRFEVIIVDDGSRDGTGALADALARATPEVRTVHHPHNRGYGAAIRSGFTAAAVPWLFFTDADGQFDLRELPALLPRRHRRRLSPAPARPVVPAPLRPRLRPPPRPRRPRRARPQLRLQADPPRPRGRASTSSPTAPSSTPSCSARRSAPAHAPSRWACTTSRAGWERRREATRA